MSTGRSSNWVLDRGCLIGAVMVLICASSPAAAQDRQVDTVTINYPDELPLAGLVDYVSQTLDVRILYGDELKGQTIILRPPSVTLPRARLLDLLSSALRMKGLALVEGDLAGFYRVVPFADMQRVVTEVRNQAAIDNVIASGAALPGRVVTQVISVPSGDTKKIATHLKAFMSSPQASLIEVPERGVVIATDYESVVARLVRLVELIDRASAEVSTHILPVQNADASQLAAQLRTILTEGYAASTPGLGEVQILSEVVPASLVVVGTTAQVEQVKQLMTQLDVMPGAALPTRPYAPRHISTKRLSTLIHKLVLGDSGDGTSDRIFVDEEANRLYLTASDAAHQRVQTLLVEVDVPMPPSARRMRIYRPKHRSAAEILDTLTHLLEEAGPAVSGSATRQIQALSNPTRVGLGARARGQTSTQVPPAPPAEYAEEAAADNRGKALRLVGPDYVLTQDAHTNVLIAMGTPAFHAQLAELIDELDRRRPQVLIEMTLVAVSLSDSLDLGVELEALDLGAGTDFLLLTSFGLSSTDFTTGQRVLAPGVGGTGVLLRPTTTPIILRALATHANSRVIATPRIVVSDNATGTIRSIDEAPFTSINASDTVATTSFAGFESAGTTLTVTPRIAAGDHLYLDYTLTFSNFTGAAAGATAPPPRSTNSFSSIVEVPDGYTVVVGGLTIENESDSISEIPLLGRIPLLGYLFQSSSASRTRSKVFAFIRPVILRDDQFEDLKYISLAHLEAAELEYTDFPPEEAMWMR